MSRVGEGLVVGRVDGMLGIILGGYQYENTQLDGKGCVLQRLRRAHGMSMVYLLTASTESCRGRCHFSMISYKIRIVSGPYALQ